MIYNSLLGGGSIITSGINYTSDDAENNAEGSVPTSFHIILGYEKDGVTYFKARNIEVSPYTKGGAVVNSSDLPNYITTVK